MEKIEVSYKSEGGNEPVYKSDAASGADLFANIRRDIVIEPGKRYLIPTGIHLEIPEGYEAQVRPRSGLAAKYGLTLLNAPGTIDADYRGEIKVLLINLGESSFKVHNGDRIAQIIFAPVVKGVFKSVSEISSTKRDKGGFGSTGYRGE